MVRDKLKIGVVGLGKMGLVHASLLNVLPNVQLVALCEKSRLIRNFSKKVLKGVLIVDDVEKLIDLNLDAVYVTTPIPSHFSIAQTVYSKGIARNLFIEKTLAQTYDEAIKLRELARRSGGVNTVGYLRRFYVTFQKAKELLSQGAIGEVSSFEAHAYSSDFLGSKGGSRAQTSRGGVLRDLGCHAVDLALWFFGDLQVTSANLGSLDTMTSEDSANFRVKRSEDLEGGFNVSWCMKNYRMAEVGFTIRGSKGVIEVNDDKVELKPSVGESSTWYRQNLHDNVPFWLGLPEYYREDLRFAKSVADRSESEPTFYNASKVDQIIEQVEQRADNVEHQN